MFRNTHCWRVAVAMAAVNFVFPLSLIRGNESSGAPRVQKSTPIDCALNAHGELSGKIIRSDGTPIAGTQVVLSRSGKELERIDCNRQGLFVFSNVRSGLYDVRTAHGGRSVRVWQPDAAPPSTRETITLVTGTVVRGQDEWDSLEVDETIIAGVAIAALTVGIIAIVVAEDDDNAASP